MLKACTVGSREACQGEQCDKECGRFGESSHADVVHEFDLKLVFIVLPFLSHEILNFACLSFFVDM